MYALNLIATEIGGFYARNELVTRYLNEYKEALNTKAEILTSFEAAAKFILEMNLEDSYWFNKANIFSLFSYLSSNQDKLVQANVAPYKEALVKFAENTHPDYQLAAKEGVNNRQQRLLRNEYIEGVLENA